MSGGTQIALAADEIVMCEHSVLGPIDPQLGQLPAASLLKVIERKPASEIDDNTFVMADMGRKAITQLKEAAQESLSYPLCPCEAEKLAEKLSTGTWTHDYPIGAKAKELGLPVSTDMPNEVRTAIRTSGRPLFRETKGVIPRS